MDPAPLRRLPALAQMEVRPRGAAARARQAPGGNGQEKPHPGEPRRARRVLQELVRLDRVGRAAARAAVRDPAHRALRALLRPVAPLNRLAQGWPHPTARDRLPPVAAQLPTRSLGGGGGSDADDEGGARRGCCGRGRGQRCAAAGCKGVQARDGAAAARRTRPAPIQPGASPVPVVRRVQAAIGVLSVLPSRHEALLPRLHAHAPERALWRALVRGAAHALGAQACRRNARDALGAGARGGAGARDGAGARGGAGGRLVAPCRAAAA